MWSRRQFLGAGAGAALGLFAADVPSRSDNRERVPDTADTKSLINAATQKAIDRCLAFLVQCQRVDGSFGEEQGQYPEVSTRPGYCL